MVIRHVGEWWPFSFLVMRVLPELLSQRISGTQPQLSKVKLLRGAEHHGTALKAMTCS